MQAYIDVTRQFKFDAAHHLPKHPGKCKQDHGHTWKVEVTFKSWIDTETGEYGLDFGKIKEVTNQIEEKLDHSDLNDTILDPSAEQIATYVWYELSKVSDVQIAKVRVWESVLFPECYVTYTGGLK